MALCILTGFDRSFLLSKDNFDILWFNDNFLLDNLPLKKLPTLPMKFPSEHPPFIFFLWDNYPWKSPMQNCTNTSEKIACHVILLGQLLPTFLPPRKLPTNNFSSTTITGLPYEIPPNKNNSWTIIFEWFPSGRLSHTIALIQVPPWTTFFHDTVLLSHGTFSLLGVELISYGTSTRLALKNIWQCSSFL